VRLIHPFHPRSGEVFEFLERMNSWRGDVVVVLDSAGRRCSFPVEWTDVAPVDVFVVTAAGRCPFRAEDLCALADLVEHLRDQGLSGVGEMTP
jgi:hypothetical protein